MVSLSMDTVEHEVDDLLADGVVAAAALGEMLKASSSVSEKDLEGVVERRAARARSTISLLVA